MWRSALLGTDRLLADFGLGLGERERVTSKAREAYGKEFRVGGKVRRRLGRRLQRERSAVEAVVTGSVASGALSKIEDVFRRRSARAAETVATIRRLDESGSLECSLDNLLRSLAQMHANRLLPVSARAQVSVRPARADALAAVAERHRVPARRVGRVGGEDLRIRVNGDRAVRLSLDQVADSFLHGLARAARA